MTPPRVGFPKPKPKKPKVRKFIARSRVKRMNPERVKREFERTMHSKARQRFVQARPCIISNHECLYYDGHSVNAHVVNDGSKGGSRKSGYRCITEMCDFHHYLLDNVIRRPEFERTYHVDLQACADVTEADWLQTFRGATVHDSLSLGSQNNDAAQRLAIAGTASPHLRLIERQEMDALIVACPASAVQPRTLP